MTYDIRNMQREENKYALYPYYPWHSPKHNDITKYVLNFKDNQPNTVNWFKQRAIEAVDLLEADFRYAVNDLYVISAPCSTAGKVNAPCESIASSLDQYFPWLHHVQQALVRITDVPKASRARQENRPRPTKFDHLRTIRYQGGTLQRSNGIIIIDDVLTTSSTFDACYDILTKNTHCEHIFGLFMSGTQSV